MGKVYRARDTRLDRTVAIKVLPAHLSHQSELKQRLEGEARTIAALNHPHICVLYDVGRSPEEGPAAARSGVALRNRDLRRIGQSASPWS
jgi:serine/threonine protein kinase